MNCLLFVLALQAEAATTSGTLAMCLEPLLHVHGVAGMATLDAVASGTLHRQTANDTGQGNLSTVAAN